MTDYTDSRSDALEEALPQVTIDHAFFAAPNLCDRFTDDQLKLLGHRVCEDFERDRNSRQDWEERQDKALRLALQVTEKKTFPWEGAANVKFPLITIAAMQFSSRAYPALINGPHPVAAEPVARRPDFRFPAGLTQAAQAGDKNAQKMLQEFTQKAQAALEEYQKLSDRCGRISRHMSYQLLEEDTDWEENHDKALLIMSILGCVFKKSYFDPIRSHNVSETVNPRDLIVNYFAKSVETAPRLTHIIYLSSNECYERAERGVFLDIYDEGGPPEPRLTYEQNHEADERQGLTQSPSDPDAPYEFLEQHRFLDLDGDGYAEPYVVTVRYDTRQVLRIVPRFTARDILWSDRGRIIRIDPIQAFTKYTFIPSPDGGFYDLGLGALLGPLNETIDSAINQLLDAGTLANAGGGFVGRGFRNKKGEYRFRPGEWKTVDSTGDDMRKNILPLPTPQPSTVLFNLLQLLIEYAESIAGAVDILQGKNPGQNTPAETSRAMVEQGMKVFNGIYKRVHRAFTSELRKLFRLNTVFISDEMPYFIGGMSPLSRTMAGDYSGAALVIKPSADPFYMSDAQRYNQATALLTVAHQSPGYDLYEVNKYYLEALKLPHIDKFLPDPKGPYAVPPPQNPKVQIEQMKLQAKQATDQTTFKLKLLELTQKAELIRAQIDELRARAEMELSQAKGVDVGHTIALINAEIAQKKNHMDGLLEAIKLLHEATSSKEGDGKSGSDSAGASGVASPAGNQMLQSVLTQATSGMSGGIPPGPFGTR